MTGRFDEQLAAVVLAGGRGTRLLPYTTSFPKPLMPVGERPILEILLGQLTRCGFTRFIFAVGHLASLIEAYFGDGSRWGVQIEYSREEQPLGTAAPLGSLADRLPSQFLVVNGDVLSDLDFGAFFMGHRVSAPPRLLTIATHRRKLDSEYGVLLTGPDGRVLDYLEKPSYPLCVSEGIYAFSRDALKWIPPRQRLDFPELVTALLCDGQPVYAYEHTGLWLDIGRPDDYAQAQRLVAERPGQFMTLGERAEPVATDAVATAAAC